ncbi:hypothetical protein [Persicirhabdus sediminis]|uniref:Uncharacterized protein n=1 Tax=Persicirhabdus sediminis TaxID=454144 RepID=A0A8J7MD64_9BACT|nr:hypothetical protein [Persicirhabdus sediminis]MBK1791222.1 hypothetical protein [Persicirhabdus sediminis]
MTFLPEDSLTKKFCAPMISLFVGLSCYIQSANGQTGDSPEGNGPFTTQEIALKKGWNAIYLELEPINNQLNEVFAGTPIEIVSAYSRPVTAMEFIDSPDEILPDRKHWNVWYAPSREDAVFSNLSVLQAHHCYLVFSNEAYDLNIKGAAFFGNAQWHPNAFNFVGFPIDSAGKPTMTQFFDSALAQSELKIYTLKQGNWVLVTQPSAEMIEPNTAYWVYSDGASDFTGPIKVDFNDSSRGGMVYNQNVSSKELVLKNVSSFPQSLTLSLVHGESGQLPVSYLVRSLGSVDQPIEVVAQPLNDDLSIGPVEPGASFKLNLQVDQELISSAVTSATLSITSTAGQRIDIPMVSLRSDLVTE